MEKEQLIIFLIAIVAIIAIVALSFNAGIQGYAINQKIRPILTITGGEVVNTAEKQTVHMNVDIGHFEQAMRQVDITVWNTQTRCMDYLGAIERPPFDFYLNVESLIDRCGPGKYTVFAVATHPSNEEITTTAVLFLS